MKNSLYPIARKVMVASTLLAGADVFAFEARPEHSSVECYNLIESVNRIDIFGAAQDDVLVEKISGPGEIKRIGDIWYWSYKAVFDDIGTTAMVKYEAKILSATGASQPVKSDFLVSVVRLRYSGNAFFPTYRDGDPAVFTNVPFRVNGKCNGLNGEYRIEVDINDRPFRSVDNSYFEFTPDYISDTNKSMEVRILYRPISGCEYRTIATKYLTIYPPPISITIPEKVRAGEYVRIELSEGSSGYTFYPFTEKLVVESDGFFADTAYMLRNFKGGLYSYLYTPRPVEKRLKDHPGEGEETCSFIIRVTNKARKLHMRYVPMKVTFINPMTGKEDRLWVTITG